MQRDHYFPGGFTRNYFGNYWPIDTIVVPPLTPPGIAYNTPSYNQKVRKQIEQEQDEIIAIVQVLTTWLSIKD